jgi:hypothetical protein
VSQTTPPPGSRSAGTVRAGANGAMSAAKPGWSRRTGTKSTSIPNPAQSSQPRSDQLE